MKQGFIFLLGLVVGAVAVQAMLMLEQADHHHHHGDTHPVGYADSEEEVHVHSDFLMHLSGTTYTFTDDRYQTTSEQELHESVHLHDNIGHIIHRHAEAITLQEFFDSLGFSITTDCIIDDTENEFCSNEDEQFLVFINRVPIESPADYVTQEEDQILIYYGDPEDATTLDQLFSQITDESCIYSGTCPERGVAPPESCGLFCSI